MCRAGVFRDRPGEGSRDGDRLFRISSQGERVEVFGQGFGVDAQNFTESRVHAAATTRRTSMLPRKGYDLQMSSFLNSLMHGKPLAVDVRDGARATLGCLKMLESAKIGQSCEIDLAEALAEPTSD